MYSCIQLIYDIDKVTNPCHQLPNFIPGGEEEAEPIKYNGLLGNFSCSGEALDCLELGHRGRQGAGVTYVTTVSIGIDILHCYPGTTLGSQSNGIKKSKN